MTYLNRNDKVGSLDRTKTGMYQRLIEIQYKALLSMVIRMVLRE